VRDVGRGLPIIVLHGGPDFDSEYLMPELDRLADLGRLVYYDQRGRGRSYSGEQPEDVSIESEMADLDRLREWTGADSVALLGRVSSPSSTAATSRISSSPNVSTWQSPTCSNDESGPRSGQG
jgi:hypothetical protein